MFAVDGDHHGLGHFLAAMNPTLPASAELPHHCEGSLVSGPNQVTIMSMASDRAIVVTGMGVVSPIGIGKEPFWAALARAAAASGGSTCRSTRPLPPAIGGEVADFDPKQYVRPRKSLKVMSRDIQLAFAAADLACVDAGLRERPVDPERLGVVFGAGMIPCELDELVGTYRGCIVDGRFDFRRWGHDGDGRTVPALDAEVSAQHAGLPHRHRPGRPRPEQHASRWATCRASRRWPRRCAFWSGARPTR